MCVALPARVLRVLDPGRILVEQQGRVLEVGAHLVPGVAAGDYVLLNLGMAAQRLTEEAAAEVLQLWRQIGEALSLNAKSTGREDPNAE
jgi:hydrogenase expression/formation protein HypC